MKVSGETTKPKMTIPERALRYILTIEAISGAGGHRDTFRVAAILRNGFALPIEDAMPIMLDWNEHNASPPWTEREIEHKLRSVDATPPIKPKGYLLNDQERAERGLTDTEVPRQDPRKRWPSLNKPWCQRI